jgi:hypothetical protein
MSGIEDIFRDVIKITTRNPKVVKSKSLGSPELNCGGFISAAQALRAVDAEVRRWFRRCSTGGVGISVREVSPTKMVVWQRKCMGII